MTIFVFAITITVVTSYEYGSIDLKITSNGLYSCTIDFMPCSNIKSYKYVNIGLKCLPS